MIKGEMKGYFCKFRVKLQSKSKNARASVDFTGRANRKRRSTWIKSTIVIASLMLILLMCTLTVVHADGYAYVLCWGSYGIDGTGNGHFHSPTSVAVDSSGYVYVIDYYNYRIQKFDSSGNYQSQFGSYGTSPSDKQFKSPICLAINQTNLLVSDVGNHCIDIFDFDGNFVSSWYLGDGVAPYGIAFDSSGNLYVADYYSTMYTNHLGSVLKFNPSGHLLSYWGTYGDGDAQTWGAYGIAVSASGVVYVADCNNNRIQEWNTQGTYLRHLGSYGTAHGQFKQPHDLRMDSSDNLYVADSSNSRVQKFDSNGNFVAQIGQFGSNNGEFNNPQGVAVDSSGNVYISDFYRNYVAKFGYETSFSSHVSPLTSTTDVGQSQQLSVTNGGVAPFTYQWLLNGVAVGSNSPTFTFTPTSTQTGTITVEVDVTDSLGVVSTSTATVTVNPLPSVTISPSSPALLTGAAQYQLFTANVQGGTGTPTYEWFLDGTQVSTSSTYNFGPFTVPTDHLVQLTVTDAVGEPASASTIITVQNTGFFSELTPNIVSMDLGQSQLFTCNHYGTGTFTYIWLADGTQVFPNPNTATYTYTPPTTGIHNVEVDVRDSLGILSSATATVTVNPLPSVTISPSSAPLQPWSNQHQLFTANVQGGTGTPTYQWFRNGAQVATGSTYDYGPYTIATDYEVWLTITDATGAHATSNTAIISAQDIGFGASLSPNPATINVGDSQQFEVSALGTPPFTYTWTLDNNPAPGSSNNQDWTYTPNEEGVHNLEVDIVDSFGVHAAATASITVITPAPTFGVQIVVQCPVNIMVTDQHGNREGSDAAGNIFDEIAGASYSDPYSDPQVITLPGASIGDYSLLLFATQTGPYTVTVTTTAPDGSTIGTGTWSGSVNQGETWGAEFSVFSDGSVQSGTLFVVPEYLLGSLLALTACFTAFAAFKNRARIFRRNTKT